MDRYKITKNLGDGTYGSVVQATSTKTNEIVAIKKMKKKFTNWEECMTLREIKSLRKLNHPNIIKLKEVIKVNDELNLVFEYLEENLYQLYTSYRTSNKKMPESLIKSLIYQILIALSFMHKNGFFHRDMKPENLLTHNGLLKICDFGLAREIRSRPPFTDYVSTRWYRAPEILLKAPNYNSPVDIFATGCIMAELYMLNPLFSGTNEIDQMLKICSVLGTPNQTVWNDGMKLAVKMGFNFPQYAPIPLNQIIKDACSDGINIMQEMLRYDPQKRPSASQLLQHPYFDSMRPIEKPMSRNNEIKPKQLGDNKDEEEEIPIVPISREKKFNALERNYNNSNNHIIASKKLSINELDDILNDDLFKNLNNSNETSFIKPKKDSNNIPVNLLQNKANFTNSNESFSKNNYNQNSSMKNSKNDFNNSFDRDPFKKKLDSQNNSSQSNRNHSLDIFKKANNNENINPNRKMSRESKKTGNESFLLPKIKEENLQGIAGVQENQDYNTKLEKINENVELPDILKYKNRFEIKEKQALNFPTMTKSKKPELISNINPTKVNSYPNRAILVKNMNDYIVGNHRPLNDFSSPYNPQNKPISEFLNMNSHLNKPRTNYLMNPSIGNNEKTNNIMFPALALNKNGYQPNYVSDVISKYDGKHKKKDQSVPPLRGEGEYSDYRSTRKLN